MVEMQQLVSPDKTYFLPFNEVKPLLKLKSNLGNDTKQTQADQAGIKEVSSLLTGNNLEEKRQDIHTIGTSTDKS